MYKIFQDGNLWCAAYEDFVNLQESSAGFGETPDKAIIDLVTSDLENVNYWQASDTYKGLMSNQGKDGFGLTSGVIEGLKNEWKDGFYLYGFKAGNNDNDADLFLTPCQIKNWSHELV